MFSFPEIITYWIPQSNDGTGGITWSSGTSVSARVSEKSSVAMSSDGKNVSTRYAIYTNEDIPLKSMVYIGDASGSLTPVSDARIVVDKSEAASMTSVKRYLI